jgi:ribosomal protein S27AE
MKEEQNIYNWEPPTEKTEPAEEKQVCQKCGNDSFRVYIKIIIDDARLYCAKCGEPFY